MAEQLELAQRPFVELQIEALVEENRIRPNRVSKFVDELEAKLVAVKELNYEKILQNFSRKFRLPLISRPNCLETNLPKNYKFVPPERLDIIGGFRTGTAIKRTNCVDLAIPIPIECLDKKDIKNHRYHQKRALYLTQLAFLLNGSTGRDLIEHLEYRYHQGDVLKPVLLITPKDEKLKKNVVFQLFIHPPQDNSMKLSLLEPTHGNIAPKWFFQNYTPTTHVDSQMEQFLEGDSEVASSPFYNSSILVDLELVANSDLLYEQVGAYSSLVDALMLTKIWLYQRELHHHFSFILSMYVAYLQTQQTIHQNMSSYQIFKLIIKSLANADWDGAGLSYYEDSKDKISVFKTVFPVIFLSPSGHLNLCYNITSDMFNRLKHEANLSQKILAKNSTDTFELLFLKKVDFINKFDVVVHLQKCIKKMPMNLERIKKFMDHGCMSNQIVSEDILGLLAKALSDRITLMQQSPNNYTMNKRWSTTSIPYDPGNEDTAFTLGLLLDAEKSLRIIDVGPQADSPEAEDFRKFWDPKSQLRLQNGIISETVVWHVDSFSQRRAILKYILIHAMKRLGLSSGNLVVHYRLLERFISLNNVYFKWRDEGDNNEEQLPQNGEAVKRKLDDAKEEVKKKPIGVGEEVFHRVLSSYNELSKVIRSVENMKHLITGIQPTSQHLRSSGVFPPLPVSLQVKNKSLKRKRGVSLFPDDFNQTGKILHIEPVEIMLTLDSSGKWPNDLSALEAAKLEYLIELGEALKEKEYTVKFAENHLDVLHRQFVFRLRVKCQKELNLIGPACGKLEYQRRRLELEILPRVHAALDQVYREKMSFGLTCRLVKRWLACHLMVDHLSDITIDLLVAHIFLQPEPYTEPASSSCGFKRFLKLISQHDWSNLPLIINFDNQLKLDEMSRLRELMLEDRSKYPPMVICTPYDKDISPWTRGVAGQQQQPSLVKLDLLVRVSIKALEFFNTNILSQSNSALDECKALFLPNFKIFNLLIKLHAPIVQNFFMSIQEPLGYKLESKETIGGGNRRAGGSAFNVMPIVGLNVIEQFVKLLERHYDDLAIFFYDKYGQRMIGVVMRPESERKLGGDMGEFINGIKRLGSKLVESVKIVKREEK